MALDYAAQVKAEDYPASNRFRDFSVRIKTDVLFVPLMITGPSPAGTGTGSVRGTALDHLLYRLTQVSSVSNATAQLVYRVDGSSTNVALTNAFNIADLGDLDTLKEAVMYATNADATPGASGFVPVIPDNATVGLLISDDTSSATECILTLRLALRESLG